MVQKEYTGLAKYRLYRWRFTLAYILLAFITVISLGLGIANLVEGVHTREVNQVESVSSISNIIDDPQNIFVKVSQYSTSLVDGLSLSSVRIGSAIIGLLSVLSFYALLRIIYWRRIAILGTLLLASSSWFLNVARFGGDHIGSVFAVALFIAVGAKAFQTRTRFWYILFGATLAISLYSPLLIYVLIGSAIALWPDIKQETENLKKSTLGISVNYLS